MKKGVVLFVTLLFIASISVLIVANMKDTQSYIDTNSSKFNITQSYYLIKDLQKSVSSKLKSIEESDDIDIYMSNNFIKNLSFELENIKVDLTFSKYEKLNINDYVKGTTEEKTAIENVLIANEIFDFNFFFTQLKDETIDSSNEFLELFRTYENYAGVRNINTLTEDLGFVANKDKNLYNLDIKLLNVNEKITANYILDDKGELLHYETSIK